MHRHIELELRETSLGRGIGLEILGLKRGHSEILIYINSVLERIQKRRMRRGNQKELRKSNAWLKRAKGQILQKGSVSALNAAGTTK